MGIFWGKAAKPRRGSTVPPPGATTEIPIDEGYKPHWMMLAISEHAPRHIFTTEAKKQFNFADQNYRNGVQRLGIVQLVVVPLILVLLVLGQARRYCHTPRGSISKYLSRCIYICGVAMVLVLVFESCLHLMIRIEEKTGFHISNNEEITGFMNDIVYPMIKKQTARLQGPFQTVPWGRKLYNLTAYSYGYYALDREPVFASWSVTREVKKIAKRSRDIIGAVYSPERAYPVQSAYVGILREVEWMHFLTVAGLLLGGLVCVLLTVLIQPFVMTTLCMVMFCTMVAAIQTVAMVELADVCARPQEDLITITTPESDESNQQLMKWDYKRACLRWYEDLAAAIKTIQKPMLLSRMYAWKSETLKPQVFPKDEQSEYYQYMFLRATESYLAYNNSIIPPLKKQCQNASGAQEYEFMIDSMCQIINIQLLAAQIIVMWLAVLACVIVLLLPFIFMKPKNICMSPICSEYYHRSSLQFHRHNCCVRILLCFWKWFKNFLYCIFCCYLIDWWRERRRQRLLADLRKYPQDSDEYDDKLEEFRRRLVYDKELLVDYPDVLEKHPQLLELVFERNPKLLEEHPYILEKHESVFKRILKQHTYLLTKYPDLAERYPELLKYMPPQDIEEPPKLDKSVKQPKYSLQRFTCPRWTCRDSHPCESKFVCEDDWTCPGNVPWMIPTKIDIPGVTDQQPTSSAQKQSKPQKGVDPFSTKLAMTMPKPVLTKKVVVDCGNKICKSKRRCVCTVKNPPILLKDKSKPSRKAMVSFDDKGRMRAPYIMLTSSEMMKEYNKLKRKRCLKKIKKRVNERRDCVEDVCEEAYTSGMKTLQAKLPCCGTSGKKSAKKK